ncbi:MAG: DUF3108 domain-containing protein [Devosia sp.]|nr:DUF3108 domain-containing protein [Devosia sp.]
MAVHRLARVLPLAALLCLGGLDAARANATASATYVINLGGTIIASAKFKFTDAGATYDLALDASISGIAQLVASGIAKVDSSGIVTRTGLDSTSFDLLTRSGGEDFTVRVQYSAGNVSSFVITPPIVNNIDRVPLERKQLSGVNDMLATFLLKGSKLDRSLCDHHAQVFTGIERFDLDFRYAKDDVATSPRTGYQGPVVLCNIHYKPISGHYTTSEITNSLAQDDRILIWYAPLRDTGYFVPYRVLLTTSMGDLSMVLTDLGG